MYTLGSSNQPRIKPPSRHPATGSSTSPAPRVAPDSRPRSEDASTRYEDSFSAGPSAGGPASPSGPRSLSDLKKKLDYGFLDALHETHVDRASRSERLRLISAAGGPPMGSEEWFTQGKDTGVWLRMPASLDVLIDYNQGDISGAAVIPPFFEAYAQGLDKINETISKLVERGATEDEVAEAVRRVVQPKTMLKEGHPFQELEKEIKGEGSGASDPAKLFGTFHRMFQMNAGDMVREFLNDVGGTDHQSIDMWRHWAEALTGAGETLLMEAAKALDLEIFEDPDAFKVDVGLKIIEVLGDSTGDQMAMSSDERDQLNAYIEELRASTHADRVKKYNELQAKHPTWKPD